MPHGRGVRIGPRGLRCLLGWGVLAAAASGGNDWGRTTSAQEPAEAVRDSEAQAQEYVGPDVYLAENRGAVYLAQARRFLAARPDSPLVSRVLLDMVVAATVMRDAAQTKQVKQEVLLDHPQSLAASFVLRSTPPADLATLFRERLNNAEAPLARSRLLKIATALESFVRDHGPAAVNDELWAAAALAQDSAIEAARLRRNIANPDSPAAKLLDIALDRNLAPREQFLRLQALADSPLAKSYQQLLYHEQLTAEDRDAAEVRTIVVENLLRKNHCAAALPELESLAERSDDPRIHYFLAWTQASQGDANGALATFEALRRRSPDSPWAQSAEQVIPLVRSLDDSLAQHVRTIERLARRFAGSNPERIEIVMEDEQPHDVRRRLRWQFSLPDDAFALSAHRGDQLVLAYEANVAGSRFFIQGDSAVKQTTSRGVCPLFTFQQQLLNEGGYAFHFHFNTIPQGGGAIAHSFRNLFSLPTLATTAGRIDMLRHQVRSGAIPEPVSTAAGETLLRWHSLNVDAPTPHCVELRLTADDRLLEVRKKGVWRLRDVQYGPRDATHFEPIVWPDSPVQEVKELQVPELMRLFAALTSLAQP